MPKCDHDPFMGYGFFPGGDPRDFHPDGESCSEEEIKAHKEACARWDAGEVKDEGHSGVIIPLPNNGVAIACGHRFGIGTYTLPCDCNGEE